MHELSLVMGVIKIAEEEMRKHQATVIEDIDIEIGVLSGVEMSAFDFAWEQAVKGTSLANAKRNIIVVEGEGICQDCDQLFSMTAFYDACPHCNQHLIYINKGKEFRVKTLTVS
jgi:hydrogenase nickel incorporation protein HypA/HybF